VATGVENVGVNAASNMGVTVVGPKIGDETALVASAVTPTEAWLRASVWLLAVDVSAAVARGTPTSATAPTVRARTVKKATARRAILSMAESYRRQLQQIKAQLGKTPHFWQKIIHTARRTAFRQRNAQDDSSHL
jgi:hypothetical protein